MFGFIYGSSQFGSVGWIIYAPPLPKKYIALVGDGSSHGGTITTSNQDGKFKVAGGIVAVEGAMHSCPITGHGTTQITSVTIKSYCNGKLIVTTGAVAGCGAIINPPNRNVNVE